MNVVEVCIFDDADRHEFAYYAVELGKRAELDAAEQELLEERSEEAGNENSIDGEKGEQNQPGPFSDWNSFL